MFDLVEFVGRRVARGFPRPGGWIRAGLFVGLVSSAALIAASGAGGGPVAAGAAGPGAAGAANLVAYAGPAQMVHETDPADGVTSGQFDSRNWDGYFTYVASEATDFNSVKASWVEPAVTCPASNAWTVFWVGLDGWWNDTVEQGGSSARCVGGTPQYDLWWEMYPSNGIQLMTGIVVRAGDAIHASVVYQTATATFAISVTDVTTGKSFSEDEQCGKGLTCARSSTEVIAEDVGSGTGYFPLADYRTMTFSKAIVTDLGGHPGEIQNTRWLNGAIKEDSGGRTYATVSSLLGPGKFSATWRHR